MPDTTIAPFANITDFNFLNDVKVVDFTQFEAGTTCTEALAWMGADVVKVENPQLGDPGRRLRPNQPDDDPYYFHIFNANKKSVTVNLKSEKGLTLVKDMLRVADVMVENFAPGAIERLGLSYEVVREMNPSIIYAQIKGFGEGSPYERNLAFDMIAQAAGGTFSVTGEADGPPTRPGISIGDTGTGMVMALTIVSALKKREKTGEGHHLQVAMQDAILHYMRTNFATTGRTGKPAGRAGSKIADTQSAPKGLFPCAPGGSNDYVYISTSAANPEHWNRLLKVVGREDLIGDKRYLTPRDRVANELEVDEIVGTWTRTQSKLEAMEKIGREGIPVGPVLDTIELNNDVTFEQRGIMQTMTHPIHEPFKMPTWPVRVDGQPTRVKASPMLGEHTDEVLRDWLNFDDTGLAALKKEGVVK
ncbi:MAG: Formyl-CoA:oxalate CoA-transferase [Alphaproteobacteria bacterium MarineAlpha4_Bin2]|nr:MAG: Formyl-CoA:oxalate CoA-transferase [Alphaproteobacteria bacterium MarineAlpha4_Bin2]